MKEELVGIEEISSDIIKCADCSQKLVDVVFTETNESRKNRGLKQMISKYKIQCPFCQGSSFLTKDYEGSVVLGTVNKDYCIEYVEDSDFKIVDDIFITTNILSLRKTK